MACSDASRTVGAGLRWTMAWCRAEGCGEVFVSELTVLDTSGNSPSCGLMPCCAGDRPGHQGAASLYAD